MATNMIGSQRAEARPPSAGGGQVSTQETTENQRTEAKPQIPVIPSALKASEESQRSFVANAPQDDKIGAPQNDKAKEAPSPNLQATSYQLQANDEPAFKPIVPLPTFIQTQFRTTQVNSQKNESRSTNYELRKEDATTPNDKQQANTSLADDPRIKSILSKFTTSSTQKPKPPAESPYKEKI